MYRTIRLVAVAAMIALLSGCALIKGVSNTSLVKPLPPTPTFQLVNASNSEPAVARKVGQMVAYQLIRRGFRNPDGTAPDLKALFDFDVVPAGATSTAFTTIDQPRGKYFVSGDTIYRKAQTATATTTVNTSQNYQKTIAVRIVDAKSGDVYWEGQVSEVGWCNQIFVTAPHILSLMFDRFPEEATNVRKTIDQNDPAVQEIRRLFPADTDWGCGR